MKKTIILIGILSLIFVSGLCLFVNHADAAISYTPSTGALVSSTSLNESWVEQMYQADKAGTLALRTSTKTGNDSSPVLHTYAFEPADYIMLGGSNNDFYVTVSGWDATLLNMTVRINGTDFFGAYQTEDILFTGDGTQYTTKAYRTSNESQVIKWYLSSGSASVSVVVGQGQWGRVWKTSVNSYRFVNATLSCSGFYNQTNTTISLYPYSTVAINVGTSGCFIFGNLSDAGVARWGCHFVNEKPDTNVSIAGTAAVTYIKFYACSFMSYPDNSSNSSLRISESLGLLDIQNCVFSQNSYVVSGGTNSIFKRNTFVSAVGGIANTLGTTGVTDDQYFGNISIPISMGTSAITASNCTLNGYDYLFKWTPIGITPIIHKLRNFKVLGNMYAQYLGTATGAVQVQLQYGIQIRTRNQSGNLSGAVIKYYQINTSSLVSTLIATVTSSSDGVAPYVFLNSSVWIRGDLAPSSNYSIHVWVNLSGYQDVHLNFTMNREMIFDVVLLPVPCIFVLSNLTRITGTNATYWNGACYTVWVNGTGNVSGIVLNDMSSGVSGSLTYWWSALTGVNGEWWVNDTHVGIGGGTGADFSMTDPNPANNSINQTGMYLNNNLSVQPGGMDCAVDVQYQNMTVLNETVLGTGTLLKENDATDNLYFMAAPDGVSQSFNITAPVIIKKIGLYINTFVPVTVSVYLTTSVNGTPTANIISTGSLLITSFVDDWFYINMSQYLLIPGMYSFYFLVNDVCALHTRTMVIPDVFLDGYSLVSTDAGITWFEDTNVLDMCFRVYGWSLGENISWNRVVNLTFKSNSSGVWTQFGFVQAVWNGTWSCFNANFTNASTVYYWSVTPETNGTSFPEQFYTFTTGTNSLIAVLEDHRILYLGIGGTLGGVLTMVCIPYIFVRRRRQEQETTT